MLDSDDEFIVRVHVGGDEAAGPESEAEQGNKHDSEAADSPAALVEDTAILATPSPAKPTGMRIKRKLNLGEKLKLQNKRLAKLNKVSKAVGNKMEKLSKQRKDLADEQMKLKKEQDAVRKYMQENLIGDGPPTPATPATPAKPAGLKPEPGSDWRKRGPNTPITKAPPTLKKRCQVNVSAEYAERCAYFKEKMQQGYNLKGTWAAWRAKQAGNDEQAALDEAAADAAKPNVDAGASNERDAAKGDAASASMRDGHQYFMKHGRKLEGLTCQAAKQVWKNFSKEEKKDWNTKAVNYNLANNPPGDAEPAAPAADSPALADGPADEAADDDAPADEAVVDGDAPDA